MNLTISVIKSIASRNVWSSDWTAPWCDTILFYKRGDYNHTHPLWQQYKEKVVRELNLTGTFDQYSAPLKITLIKFKGRGFHQPMKRKAVYISLDSNILVGSVERDPVALMGEIDKVNTTPSWRSDFWNQKRIWVRDIEEEEYDVVGNTSVSCVYPEEGHRFIEVLYK